MATIEQRPYSDNYSGMRNQSVLALAIGSLCITAFELMRFKRRKTKAHLEALKHGKDVGLERVESWEWGYLYQGRCWSKRPSPPLPKLPLAWVKQMIQFPEEQLLPLIGPDSTVYARFLRGAFWYTLLHSVTTLPIILPIHVTYSPDNIPSRSMTRASLSSLTKTTHGQRLLVIHLIILAWLSLTWIANLFWLCRGAFRYRSESIKQAADEANAINWETQTSFKDEGRDGRLREGDFKHRGWRLKTVMVSNLPVNLRDDKTLKEYFEFYMSQKINEPPPAPGLVQGIVSFLSRFHQARYNARAEAKALAGVAEGGGDPEAVLSRATSRTGGERKQDPPVIEKVVIVRKMTELASLLERREEVLRKLEEAHIKLASKVMHAVVQWQKVKAHKSEDGKQGRTFLDKVASRRSLVGKSLETQRVTAGLKDPAEMEKDVEQQRVSNDSDAVIGDADAEAEAQRMDLLAQALQPFIDEFGLTPDLDKISRKKARRDEAKASTSPLPLPRCFRIDWIYHSLGGKSGSSNPTEDDVERPPSARDLYPPTSANTDKQPRRATEHHPHFSLKENSPTIWEVLHCLPRDHLDAFQPLIRLSSLFRGATVPAIDYHTAKLGLLTALINENRSRTPDEFTPASTAFVTFASPADARRVVKILPSHPKNPLTCLVEPAPEVGDLDWSRLMTSTFTGEFLKDWVVDVGVWAFTCFWIIPVTLFVSLVSISKLSNYLPWLKRWLDANPFEREILSSLIPTLLVTLLAILIPLILLLLAKKAHNIVHLSKLHDQIMTRYHKFLVCNVLIFFCVGVSALQAFLQSFRQPQNPLPVVADKFPEAAPFYVGWLIFQTGMHNGLELGLLGLPLLVYPATVRGANCPRRRKAGTRPRTFNFYYWLPNHTVVLFVLFVFAILNPLVIPFACLYFAVSLVVFKHQFLHVYSKAYECNANVILIRMVRYTLDGVALSQFVFLALMIFLKHSVLAGFSGLFMGLTILLKIFMTRFCRRKFEEASIAEADAFCPPIENPRSSTPNESRPASGEVSRVPSLRESPTRRRSRFSPPSSVRFWTWKLPGSGVNFAYSTFPARGHGLRRQPNPFAPNGGNGASQEDLVQSQDEGNDRTLSLLIPGDPTTPQPLSSTSAFDPFEHAVEAESIRRGSLVDLWTTRRHDLVQPHETVQLWDDHPRHDQTYDNPHYTRSVDNVLWLPKNPVDILDLDDTVDVFRALTSEPGAGQLGQWMNESGSILPEVSNGPSSAFGLDDEDSEQRALFGNENISMSSILASRVGAADRENDIEFAGSERGSLFLRRRPTSTLRRQPSSKLSTHSYHPPGRSFSGGTIPPVPPLPTRSFSGTGFQPPAQSPRPRTERMLSTNSIITRSRRSSSAMGDPALQPDLFSQTPFADPNLSIILRSNSRIAEPMGEPSRRSDQQFGIIPGRPRAGTGVSVTTREAVVGEVLAEEQIATADRMRREQAETQQAGGHRSWLTSWMYSYTS